MPHWPYLVNFHGLPNSFALASAAIVLDVARITLQVPLVEFRLGITQFDVTGPPCMKRKRSPWFAPRSAVPHEVADRRRRSFQHRLWRGRGVHIVLLQQPGQCQAADSKSLLLQGMVREK